MTMCVVSGAGSRSDCFSGPKILPVQTVDGKLRIADLAPFLHSSKEEHHVQPRAPSNSQSTEYGGLYEIAELRELCAFAHDRGLLVHMDGARIFNAAAHLNVPLSALTSEVGVDALSFGGTKNGLIAGEAVVFFKRVLADDFEFRRMQGMQLSSKIPCRFFRQPRAFLCLCSVLPFLSGVVLSSSPAMATDEPPAAAAAPRRPARV